MEEEEAKANRQSPLELSIDVLDALDLLDTRVQMGAKASKAKGAARAIPKSAPAVNRANEDIRASETKDNGAPTRPFLHSCG
jgi:hypothetical protein